MVERELPADWDHFHVLLEQLLKRVPSLRNASLERLCNGPEAFSPDCKWILGESPEVWFMVFPFSKSNYFMKRLSLPSFQIQNYLIAVGMKTVGISAAGGVGRAIADIIIKGYSSVDLYELDVSRFLGLHNNRRFLMDRVREVPGSTVCS